MTSPIAAALLAHRNCQEYAWDKSSVAHIVAELDEEARGHLLVHAVRHMVRPSAIRQIIRTRSAPVPDVFVRQALTIALALDMPRKEDLQRMCELANHKSCTLVPDDIRLGLLLLKRSINVHTTLSSDAADKALDRLIPIVATAPNNAHWPALALALVTSHRRSLVSFIPWGGIWAGPSGIELVPLVLKALGDGNSNTNPTNPWVGAVLAQCPGIMDTIVEQVMPNTRQSDLVALAAMPEGWAPHCTSDNLERLNTWVMNLRARAPRNKPDANLDAIQSALDQETLQRSVAHPTASRSALRM